MSRANRMFQVLSRGTTSGNRGKRRRGGRPRGEGAGLIDSVKRLLGRR